MSVYWNICECAPCTVQYLHSVCGHGSFCKRYFLSAVCYGGLCCFNSSCLIVWCLVFLVFLLRIPHEVFMGFCSGGFTHQSTTLIPWSIHQVMVLLAVWANPKFFWKNETSYYPPLMTSIRLDLLASRQHCYQLCHCATLPFMTCHPQ